MEEISDKIKTLTSLRNDLLGKLAHREQKDFNKDNTSKIDEIINKKLQNFSIELEEFYQ